MIKQKKWPQRRCGFRVNLRQCEEDVLCGTTGKEMREKLAEASKAIQQRTESPMRKGFNRY